MPKLYANAFDDHLAACPDGLEELRSLYEADYSAHVADTTRLYPGVQDALQELAGLYPLALVTNKPEAISRQLLDALGVGGLFCAVVGGDSFAEAKPSPAMLSGAVERSGCGPCGVVMVGDSPGDILMARAHGSPSIWCAWGYYDAPGPHAPAATVRHPAELAAAAVRFHSPLAPGGAG